MTKYTEAEMLDIDELETIIADGARFRLLLDDEAQTENVLSCSHLTDIMETAILAHDRRQAAKAEPVRSAIGSALASIGKRKPATKTTTKRKTTKRKPAKKRKTAPVYSSKLLLVEAGSTGALKMWNGKLVEGMKSCHTIGIETFRSENGETPVLHGRRMYSKAMLARIVNLDDDDTELLKNIVNS
jgi:hypothetical protein